MIDLPTSLPSLTLGGALGATVTWGAKLVLGYFSPEREARDIYRVLNDALEKKVSVLEARQTETLTELKALKEEIGALTNKNSSMESLIIQGLQAYFEAHPEEAQRLRRTLRT